MFHITYIQYTYILCPLPMSPTLSELFEIPPRQCLRENFRDPVQVIFCRAPAKTSRKKRFLLRISTKEPQRVNRFRKRERYFVNVFKNVSKNHLFSEKCPGPDAGARFAHHPLCQHWIQTPKCPPLISYNILY